jgi:hypothetical protein
MFLLVVLPTASMFGLDASRPWEPFVLVLFSIAIIQLITRLSIIRLREPRRVKYGYEVAIAICLSFVIFLATRYLLSGASINFNLNEVYEYRGANADKTSGGLLTYTNIWTYKVFNLVLIGLALHKKSYLLAGVFTLIQIFFFGIANHKIILFGLILVYSSWFLFSRSNNLSVLPFVAFISIFCVLSLDVFFPNSNLSSLFIRRLYFTPASLNFAYYEFFAENPYFLWSDSIMKSVIDNDYKENMSRTIGAYLGKPGVGANNGFIFSGYAQGGILGVILYSIVLALVLRVLNNLSHGSLPKWLVICVVGLPIFSTISNSDLLTSINTHGIGISLVIIYLMKMSKKEAPR